ncbi:RNA polymerase sigma-70 factor [Parafilimonas terrae]|uniref:RNA polymerase sigma-70 factor, ECF subfamily n=1 Tax=Parafilimonas terrae TaxID=1465490 RepID=A0A1I5UCB4_9BACT|nr:RNA polymerase sigma-70 factor [Parafilimonas terrae]SFP92848.1 RNA polymerase sigma-70 factor, ECF subfamily [Parafilimonas terrae]
MKRRTKTDTTQLQLELADGNETALKRLYDLFGERLLHFTFTIVHNRELAEEIVADVFIQTWKKRVQIASIENLPWYLYVTAKNISLNYLRKERKQKFVELEIINLPLYTIEPQAVQHLISKDFLQSITNAINELPPKCRLIFKLVKDDGLTYKETAELLNLSIKTVEAQMGIALKKIHTTIQVLIPVYARRQQH